MLLAVLSGVLIWGYLDVRGRRERTTWERPLSVAIVIVKNGAVDPIAIKNFCDRSMSLSARLDAEKNRYRADGVRPFIFQCFGPVESGASPPSSEGDGWVDAVKQTFALGSYSRAIDAAAGINKGDFDSRIYVAVRPPERADRNLIEGVSENGGRIGTVSVELDDTMVDFALFVSAHELFHTLGASDKYDANGFASVPDGLADPDASPRYPQSRAEIMARGRPLAAGREIVPTRLEDLGVGPATAREIGWK